MRPSSITLPVNGVNLHVAQAGQGETAIVFLHYWGGSSRTWQPVIDQLSGRFRCVAIDLRGWGKSDHTAKNFSLDIQASDVTGAIADLGLSNFILVGHSMGGKIAQIVASRSPSGLRALVLVAPAPPPPALISAQEKQMRLGGYSTEEGIGMVLGILAARPLSDALRRQIVDDTLGGQQEAKEAWIGENMAVDISGDVSAIDVPVHVIVGNADRVETEETLRREIPEFLGNTRFHILDGVGHLAPLEAPGDVASIIGKACDAE